MYVTENTHRLENHLGDRPSPYALFETRSRRSRMHQATWPVGFWGEPCFHLPAGPRSTGILDKHCSIWLLHSGAGNSNSSFSWLPIQSFIQSCLPGPLGESLVTGTHIAQRPPTGCCCLRWTYPFLPGGGGRRVGESSNKTHLIIHTHAHFPIHGAIP